MNGSMYIASKKDVIYDIAIESGAFEKYCSSDRTAIYMTPTQVEVCILKAFMQKKVNALGELI